MMDESTVEDTKQRRGSCCGLWGLVILLGLLPLLIYGVLTAAGGILIVGDPLQRSDVVVLLGGGDQQRMEEAVRIYKEKYAGLLILTETGEVDPKFGQLYSSLQLEEAIALGVPRGGIIFTGEHGNSSYAEAQAVRDLLTLSGKVTSAIIVTDPYHTLRTRLIYRQVFKGSGVRVTVQPVRGHWYRSTSWWQSRAGWEATMTEYAKLFAWLAGVRGDEPIGEQIGAGRRNSGGPLVV